MHSWEVIDHYCQFHPRWFENADRYVPDEAHLNVYKELIPDSWRLRRGGIWFSADPPGERNYPDQGWKLHISASSKNSAFVLRRVLSILRDLPASFKFLIDPWLTFLVNGKLWPRGSSGKFITIYPSSMEHFLQLGQQLTQELDGLVGPYILSDRRWPKSFSVYYRYGGIRPRSVLQVDGRRQPVIVRPDGTTVPDVRTPYWQLPDGVLDPFPRDTTSDDAAVGFVGAGRFSVKTVLSFSNRGGVYEAYDKNTGEKVILKEARPGVEVGRNRIDAISVLEKEYRLLQKLAATGYTIKPIAYFREWEHAFLAEEFVPGE